ncbi:MAG: hypothetical protein KatS3mg054_1067 [Chloroflexus sp.]|nr:MAG: hypothetical protein KatS3mg054_1067 [Chloroflexus sp.]
MRSNRLFHLLCHLLIPVADYAEVFSMPTRHSVLQAFYAKTQGIQWFHLSSNRRRCRSNPSRKRRRCRPYRNQHPTKGSTKRLTISIPRCRPIGAKTLPHSTNQRPSGLPAHPVLPIVSPNGVGAGECPPNRLSVAHEHTPHIGEVLRPIPTQSIGIRRVDWVIPTIQVHIRMPTSHAYRVSLQPPCRARVVLPCADMV